MAIRTILFIQMDLKRKICLHHNTTIKITHILHTNQQIITPIILMMLVMIFYMQ